MCDAMDSGRSGSRAIVEAFLGLVGLVGTLIRMGCPELVAVLDRRVCRVGSGNDESRTKARVSTEGLPSRGPLVERAKGFGHAVYCARHALAFETPESQRPATAEGELDSGVVNGKATAGSGLRNGSERGYSGHGGHADVRVPPEDESDGTDAFLLVLGDHLYRRGPGTSTACASQLIGAYLEHGQRGKPAIGLKVCSTFRLGSSGVAGGHDALHLQARPRYFSRRSPTPPFGTQKRGSLEAREVVPKRHGSRLMP